MTAKGSVTNYKKALKRLVFLEDNFDVNHLPQGYSVKDYKEDIKELRKIVKNHLDQNYENN